MTREYTSDRAIRAKYASDNMPPILTARAVKRRHQPSEAHAAREVTTLEPARRKLFLAAKSACCWLSLRGNVVW